jgi:hypothetical protein
MKWEEVSSDACSRGRRQEQGGNMIETLPADKPIHEKQAGKNSDQTNDNVNKSQRRHTKDHGMPPEEFEDSTPVRAKLPENGLGTKSVLLCCCRFEGELRKSRDTKPGAPGKIRT